MAARTPSIHVFLGRPLFLLSPGIHSIINFGSRSTILRIKNVSDKIFRENQNTILFPATIFVVV